MDKDEADFFNESVRGYCDQKQRKRNDLRAIALALYPRKRSMTNFTFSNTSPAGHKLVETSAGTKPALGSLVRVTNAGNGIREACEGTTGTLIGFTATHGYAAITTGERTLLIHPESLEAV